jgi:allophanate hydrolase
MSTPTPALDDGLRLDVESLQEAYRAGALTPSQVAKVICQRLEQSPPSVWIHRLSRDEILAAAVAIEKRAASAPSDLARLAAMPLYGIPFAVKDNIDVAGLPTTAALPAAITSVAGGSATVVTRLVEAGGFLVGKTNMDQLATGLVGTRSPYGAPGNPFDARFITGGSSSGSAVAVSRGLVSFALGTDTAGSGRVPAAFTNTVGLKPSPGLFSTAGVVPACRSLDCVSIFALTVDDVAAVARVLAAYDPGDPFSRPEANGALFDVVPPPTSFRFGVPRTADREYFGDREAERLFEAAEARFAALGGKAQPIDLQPFFETARLLYDGPWIAERLSAHETLVDQHPEALLPVVRDILRDGKAFTGMEVFRAQHRLAALRQQVRGVLADLDFLLTPTTPTIYTLAQIEAEPRKLNANLGRYTNFVNLLGLAALAVPNGFRADGLPSGVTLIGPSDSDARLAGFGAAYHRKLGGTIGAGGHALPVPATRPIKTGATVAAAPTLRLAVVGAHLTGQPLNGQLIDLGARLVRTCNTAPRYRLFALPGIVPPKPGLLRSPADAPGVAIEVEVWEMPLQNFGAFFARITPPLGMGTVELEDGEKVTGFLCEAYATVGARDISGFGGWRKFLANG